MVLSRPYGEVQLTDTQFFNIVTEQRLSTDAAMTSGRSTLKLTDLLGYETVTIIFSQTRERRIRAHTPPHEIVCPQIPAPKQLNIVIIGGRAADIRPVFKHFSASHKSLHDNLHENNLASQETVEKVNNLTIVVWNGRIIPSSENEFVPTLEIPSGLSRADLYVKDWSDSKRVDDIPWVFGQLCRNGRPRKLGFHLLSACGSALTDKWRMQKPCMYSDNTLLRKLHVTGISSDGFLRLLQCARIEIWCIRELKITLPKTCSSELCFWDFRVFDKITWPFTTEQADGDYCGFPDEDWQDFLTFPRLALKRFVGGRVVEVVKERMDAPCQIASQYELGGIIVWGMLEETDIECYSGRSLKWTSLDVVQVEGGLDRDARRELERLSLQCMPRLVALG